MADFLAPFAALGHDLDAAFRRAQYAEAAFADLAVEHVARARLHASFDLRALARWALSAHRLPRQHDLDADFGDPPLTLWNARRFSISALVWRSSTTTIHQHAFTGAFQVLHGSSVHARYAFQARREISEDLVLGALRCTSIERLVHGDVRAIPPGPTGAHALFHLEHPSVSLVVRTHYDARHPIQYDYHAPGIALWSLRNDPERKRACQVMRMLVDVDPEAAVTMLAEALPSLPGIDGLALLDELRVAASIAQSLKALAIARPRLDGELADAFEATLVERDRADYLRRRRDAVREPGPRYLLAILLNAPTRVHALALAEAHTPGRSGAETLVTWLRELSSVTIKLQVAGRPWEPNVLALPEADEASCAALRAELAGGAPPAEPELPFYQAVRHGSAFAPLFRA